MQLASSNKYTLFYTLLWNVSASQ